MPSLLQSFADESPLTENRAELLFPLFGSTGAAPPTAPAATPDTARICDCNNVSKAQIIEAVMKGARSVQAVSDVTHA